MICYCIQRSPLMQRGYLCVRRYDMESRSLRVMKVERESYLKSQQQFCNIFRQQGTMKQRLILGCAAVMLALLVLGASLGLNKQRAHAQASSASTAQSAHQSQRNQFPWPQCTWWANQRYHQQHGIFVPWRTQSNAWQWKARAHDFHWRLSNAPAVGSIMVLQPGVQGAYGGGHVGVVEKVLGHGYFIASNLNWGAHPTVVTYVKFHAGAGVTFVHR